MKWKMEGGNVIESGRGTGGGVEVEEGREVELKWKREGRWG